MMCPNCKLPLSSAKYRTITIHECSTCNGKWFEGKELPLAIEKRDDDLRWENFSLFEEKSKKYAKLQSKKLCPEDNIPMYSLKYMDSSIVIDKCEHCGGIWLDKNEFDAIVKFLENVLITETASEYAKDAWRQFVEIGTKHDGTIAEIKDFLVVMKLFETRLIAENPSMQTAIEKTLEYVPYN
jgi:Zn-finger nucleic acid-binding protein